MASAALPNPFPIPFAKYHASGNDFILIDTITHPALADLDFATLAPHWCHRHFGIGADQILVLGSVPDATLGVTPALTLRIFNADGSQAGMCGNGLRCIAHHAAQTLRMKGDHCHVHIEISPSDSPARTVSLSWQRDARGDFTLATVKMGKPILGPAQIPVICEADRAIRIPLPPELRTHKETLHRAGMAPHMSCVSVGNPHAVLFCQESTPAFAAQVGPILERAACFPQRTNVQIAQVAHRDRLKISTWERGTGPTLACGSGACATVIAAILEGLCDREVTVSQAGGRVQVRWDESSGDVFLIGDAVLVYAGAIAGNLPPRHPQVE